MQRQHPFDSIPIDGDGRGVPDVEPDTVDEMRAAWRAMNAAEVRAVVPRR